MKYKKAEHFFKNVLAWLRIYNWNIRWVENSTEGYCWKRSKLIDIGANLEEERLPQLILHEIAHIRTSRFSNNPHDRSFWREYDTLAKKFLPKLGISKSDSICRDALSGIAFYRVAYQNDREALCLKSPSSLP